MQTSLVAPPGLFAVPLQQPARFAVGHVGTPVPPLRHSPVLLVHSSMIMPGKFVLSIMHHGLASGSGPPLVSGPGPASGVGVVPLLELLHAVATATPTGN